MAEVRIIPLEESVKGLCARLAREPGSALSGAARCILVTSAVDAKAIADIDRELPPGSLARSRSIVVYREHNSVAVRKLLAAGIGDVIQESECTLEVIRARLARWSRIDAAVAQPLVANNLIGSSGAWLAALRTIAESALFSSAPVLITGPTGTGKELLARMLHSLDPRVQRRDLMIVDCTTLSRELAGSELFGHERGAFTGAAGERDGAIACADGGTLFLDEVGELAPDLQGQFLRVLQEKAYRRIGSTNWRRVEFRLVCATNRQLQAEVEAGRFRADLYHRIAATTCRTPALAERRADIPGLVQHLVAAAPGCNSSTGVSPGLLEYLCNRQYPGNVRELHHLVQVCIHRYAGVGQLTLACLPDEEIGQWRSESSDPSISTPVWQRAYIEGFARSALQANVGLKELSRVVEAAAVRVALQEYTSITAAAQRLGVTPRALHLRRAAERDDAHR